MGQSSSRYGKQSRAERVSFVGEDISRATGGQYRIAMKSGLLTLVAAQTATAGHIAAFRNASATTKIVVDRFMARWFGTTGATAQQVVGLQLFRATAYTASHTGGTAATVTTTNGKKNTAHLTIPPIATGVGLDLRIGTTGALTAGTHTLDAQPLAANGVTELAVSAAVPLAKFDMEFAPTPSSGKLVLAQDEGLILTNTVLGGTAMVWNVAIEIDFQIVDNNAFLQ